MFVCRFGEIATRFYECLPSLYFVEPLDNTAAGIAFALCLVSASICKPETLHLLRRQTRIAAARQRVAELAGKTEIVRDSPCKDCGILT